MVGLGIPLILGKIPPNRWYGLRLRATLSDPRIWFPANRRMGFDMSFMGLIIVVVGLIAPLAGMSDDAYALLMSVLLLALTSGMAFRGWRYTRRLARMLSDYQTCDHTGSQRH